MPDNAIVKRQKQLTGQWSGFTDLPDARLCRWLINPDELSMLKAFYSLQISDGNDTGDFFIKLSAPFANQNTYAYDLQKEFLSMVKQIQEEIEEPEIKLWKPLPKKPSDSPLLHFLSMTDLFARCINLSEGYLVIYLQPQMITDNQSWLNWLMQVMQFGIPHKVRWMVMDDRRNPILNQVAKYFPKQTCSITPDLKMNAAINELASSGDPKNPGVQFRMAFVHLTQAIGKQDMALVEKTAGKAFRIAEKNNWPHMKVAVNMAKAGAYLGKKEYKQAYQIYGEGYQYASKAFKEGDPASGKLAVTTLFSQGASMLCAKDYDLALKAYLDAVPYTLETKDFYNQMEAWRMAGHCYQQLKDDKRAWDAYWNALETGPKLEKEIRPSSTLPFIGQELLTLAGKVKKMDLYKLIQDRMVFLVGNDWAEKAKVS
jgi:tetratricopeptide (TPR) repeat protein